MGMRTRSRVMAVVLAVLAVAGCGAGGQGAPGAGAGAAQLPGGVLAALAAVCPGVEVRAGHGEVLAALQAGEKWPAGIAWCEDAPGPGCLHYVGRQTGASLAGLAGHWTVAETCRGRREIVMAVGDDGSDAMAVWSVQGTR